MEDNKLHYMDITELMDTDALPLYKKIEETGEDTDEEPLDGEMLSCMQAGEIIKIKDGNQAKEVFVLSIDRENARICATPVSKKSEKGSVYVESTASELDVGKVKLADTKCSYIRTDVINTYDFSDIISRDVEEIIPTPAYLEVLNRIIRNFRYDNVVQSFEAFCENIEYEKLQESARFHGIKLQESQEPKTIMIQKLKKQLDKATSELSTAKKYKDDAKKELQNWKKDNQSMKDNLLKLKNENLSLVKEASDSKTALEELTGKYHELLEKYATEGRDPKLYEETEALKEKLKSTEAELLEVKERATALISENEGYKYDMKKYHNEHTQTIKDLKSQLTTAEIASRKLSDNIASNKKTIESLKSDITKKDKEIEHLKKKASEVKESEIKAITPDPELLKEIERLKEENATLKEVKPITTASNKKEYILTPGEDVGEDEPIALPSVIGFRLKKLMDPVPKELRASLLTQMISYFEDSVKEGEITVNMLTKLTF